MIAACSYAVLVPLTASVNRFASSVLEIIAIAALLFSFPNSLVTRAWSFMIPFKGFNLSESESELSVNVSMFTPAACNSAFVSFGKNLPCAKVAITLRSATPPSAPFFPFLSST